MEGGMWGWERGEGGVTNGHDWGRGGGGWLVEALREPGRRCDEVERGVDIILSFVYTKERSNWTKSY